MSVGSTLAAPPVVLSAAPDKVAVTLYRDPSRGDDAIDRNDPSSFALIVETRTVTLPPGETVVRFEGVASGIVPQSAILFGTDPRERNRDAALLSQRGLVDAFTGQRVILKRTDPATGKVTEEPATIRSAADRLVATTPRGVEAIYCSGLSQTLIYPGVPATLSPKPVLSMMTKHQGGGKATITLAYIATGFDWDATYVGNLSPDGQSLSLLGWLTMASADDTSFIDATTSAVAGKVNRSDDTVGDEDPSNEDEEVDTSFRCWPQGTTGNVPSMAVPPPPPAPMMEMDMDMGDIVVTGAMMRAAPAPPMSIAVKAKAENLGDLKLYRIPVPVTVAARSQKQVAFLLNDRIAGNLVYRAKVYNGEPEDLQMLFRFRNRKVDGAGDPLPAGKAVLYQDGAFGRMLIGESSLPDKALDEEVELTFGEPANVRLETVGTPFPKHDGWSYIATIRNANPFPVRFEVDFPKAGGLLFSAISGTLLDKPGKRVWTATIPANNSVVLTYRATDRD